MSFNVLSCRAPASCVLDSCLEQCQRDLMTNWICSTEQTLNTICGSEALSLKKDAVENSQLT